MSIELFGYSGNATPVAIPDLVAACRSLDFECRVIRGGSALASGVLTSDDAVVGWHPSLFGNRSARTAAERADWSSITKLEARGSLGVCHVDVWDEPEQYNHDIDPGEMEDVYGPEYVELRRSSRVRWYIRLQRGSDGRSVELADAVLRSLLMLRGGVLENPQFGEYEIVQPEP